MGPLLVIFLTVFVDLLGFGLVIPLLPIYADQFTVDDRGIQLGLLMASFSLMQFIFAPFWGVLSDRIGRRPVLMIGLAGSVVCYTLFGIATVMQSFSLLFISRVGAGIAGATISTAQAYIADTTSLEDRSKGMALIGMAFGLGFTFGPLLGFLAVPDRAAVPGPLPGYVAAAFSAVALFLAAFLLPESKRSSSQSAVAWRLNWSSTRAILAVPSILLVLLAIFLCVYSFANFETTLSLLIKGERFRFSWGQVCLTYAFIGFTLAAVQGGLVRRLAGRLSEGTWAASGALAEVVGFLLLTVAVRNGSLTWLLISLVVITTGFAFMQPNLNALLSRRTPSSSQGVILGVGQSMSSMARIVGAAIGIPLLKINLTIPYFSAAALMICGALLITVANRQIASWELKIQN